MLCYAHRGHIDIGLFVDRWYNMYLYKHIFNHTFPFSFDNIEIRKCSVHLNNVA